MTSKTKERIPTLLVEMTLDEKLAQMVSCWIYEIYDGTHISTSSLHRLMPDGIGQITRLAGATTLEPAAVARTANEIQRFLVEQTRPGIPAIIHEECCAGYMGLGGTVFPQMIGLASTFEPALAEKMTRQIRAQMRAVGAHQGLAPVLDIGRDPRWGRIEETFGEDPTLVANYGVAYIRGLQGKDLRQGVMATGKHFVGHSFSEGGLNCAPVHLGEREMWEVLLGPFQAAIRDAGLHTMMNAYPELDGELVAASRRILTDLLRDKLGFEGLIVSDYEALRMIHTYHQMTPDFKTAAILGLEAGIEQELPTRVCYSEPLRQALDNGEVNLELVDHAVERILNKKQELGLFDHPYVDENKVGEVFETPENRALAREIARKSIVLLQNDGVLPLPKSIRTLAVIGPNADSARSLQSAYHYAPMLELLQFQQPAPMYARIDENHLAAHTVEIRSVLSALREALPGTQILYSQGCDHCSSDSSGFAEAAAFAQQADAVVLVLGDLSGMVPACTVGETRDSAELRLPGIQEQLARAVFDTGKPVIVALITGRPYAIQSLSEQANAILECWIPGEEGGQAIAEVLVGDVNPGGKLPVTIPRHVGQLPLYYNQKTSGGKSNWYENYVTHPTSPLFPFGHGLSYTQFVYHDFCTSSSTVMAGETQEIGVRVTNTGPSAGDEVVQLYVRDEYASLPRPKKELKGFIRVHLEPGECKHLIFQLPVNQLAFYDQNLDLVVERGTVKVMIGSSSTDIRCEGSFEIVGDQKTLVFERVFTCPVLVE